MARRTRRIFPAPAAARNRRPGGAPRYGTAMTARRARLLLGAVALAFLGCGDDASDSGSPHAGAPPPAATDAASSTDAGGPTDDLAGWTRTAPGDWATWEVRVDGDPSVTRLTWRAVDVRAGIVRYAVESSVARADGHVLAETRSEETHGAAADVPDPATVRGAARGEDVAVGGRNLSTRARTRSVAGRDVTVWTSVVVPFSGVVRASGAGVEQRLVDFGPRR
jgi:hypothetical protein